MNQGIRGFVFIPGKGGNGGFIDQTADSVTAIEIRTSSCQSTVTCLNDSLRAKSPKSILSIHSAGLAKVSTPWFRRVARHIATN